MDFIISSKISQWYSKKKLPLWVFYEKIFLKISQNLQENTPKACTFINKRFYDIIRNTYFAEHLQTASSVYGVTPCSVSSWKF